MLITTVKLQFPSIDELFRFLEDKPHFLGFREDINFTILNVRTSKVNDVINDAENMYGCKVLEIKH